MLVRFLPFLFFQLLAVLAGTRPSFLTSMEESPRGARQAFMRDRLVFSLFLTFFR